MTKKERKLINTKNLKRNLKPLWDYFNEKYFESTLPQCPNFLLCQNAKFLAAYSFDLKKGTVKNQSIIFSEKFFYKASQKMFKEAFLHEMTHQFIIEVLNLPHENHGPIWKMICRAININSTSKTVWHE